MCVDSELGEEEIIHKQQFHIIKVSGGTKTNAWITKYLMGISLYA